jgi:DNA-binding MarR family transcriptional regulator
MADPTALFTQLTRFEGDVRNAVDKRLRSDHGLQLTWFEAMHAMSTNPTCRVLDIKDELSITVGGASKLVDRIEAAGLCRRRTNPNDRRSQIVQLTPAGRRLLMKATTSFDDELQNRLGSVVSVRALQQFGATRLKLRVANTTNASAQLQCDRVHDKRRTQPRR